MPASIVQEVSGTTAGAGTTEAVTLTVGANRILHVFATWLNTGGVTAACSDNLNGTYGAALDTITGATQSTAHWAFLGTLGGSTVVTITFSGTTTNKAIAVKEISGANALQVHAAQSQTAPGTGTDAVSSGTATPTSQPALISALTNALTTTPAAAGTGFTAGTGGWSISSVTNSTTESERITSTSAVAATFTAVTGSAVYHTLQAIFTEGTAFLYGRTNNSTATVAIDTVGLTDWIHWVNKKTAGTIRKSGGGSLISDYTVTGTGAADHQYTNDPATMSWTGGTPTASGSDTNGVYVDGTPAIGFTWTIPVGTTLSTIVCYFGYFNAGTHFTATLSDGSAPQYVHDEGTTDSTAHDFNVTLNVAAASAGQTLTIAFSVPLGTNGSNVNFRGIALTAASTSIIVQADGTVAAKPGQPRITESNLPGPLFVARGTGLIDTPAPRAIIPHATPVPVDGSIPSQWFATRGSGLPASPYDRAYSTVVRPLPSDHVLPPMAAGALSAGLIEQPPMRRPLSVVSQAIADQAIYPLFRAIVQPEMVTPRASSRLAVDGQIPSQGFAAVGSGAVDSQTMSRPPALAARALTDQVPPSLFQPIFQADGTIPKVILKLVTDSQIPSQDFVASGSGFFDTTPLPRPPALVARAVDGPIPSRNFAAVGSGILEQNPPARPVPRVVLATEGQVLPPLFLPIVQADGTVAYAFRRLSTDGPIPSQLFAARGSGLFDPAPIARPPSLVSRAATDQVLVPMFGPSIVGDVAWRPRPLVILSVDGALPEIFGVAAGAGPIDAGLAPRPPEARRRQMHAETALSLLLGPAVQADATAPRGWRARFLEQAALGAPVPTSIFGLVDMGAPTLVPWMRPRVSENLISPQIPFVALKIADSPLLARLRPPVILSTDGPVPVPFMVAVGSGVIDAWTPALRRAAPRSPVDLQALAALFGPAIDAPCPASWRWRVRPVVDAVVPGPLFGPVVDSDPGQRRGSGARQAWSDGIVAIRLAGPIADAEPGTRRWTAAHVILDGGVVPPRPPLTTPIVQADSFGARRGRANLSTDNAVPTGFVVTVFGLVDAGRPQPVDRARQRGTDLAILSLLPPQPPFSRIARPAIVEFCVASTVDDIVLFQDYQKLMSVEFAGRVSASNRHDDPIPVEVFRTIGAVVAQSLGGLQMYLHVTTTDGVQVVPLSGCVILDGTGIVGLAVSGWGEVEILLLGNM